MRVCENCEHRDCPCDIMICKDCMADHTKTGNYPRFEQKTLNEDDYRRRLTEGIM